MTSYEAPDIGKPKMEYGYWICGRSCGRASKAGCCQIGGTRDKVVLSRRLSYTMRWPESANEVILSTPPKKPQDWKFMQDFEGDVKDLEE